MQDAGLDPNFTEDELRFFNILATYAQDEEVRRVSRSDLIEAMWTAQLDSLVTRMHQLGIAQFDSAPPVGAFVMVNSVRVFEIQDEL